MIVETIVTCVVEFVVYRRFVHPPSSISFPKPSRFILDVTIIIDLLYIEDEVSALDHQRKTLSDFLMMMIIIEMTLSMEVLTAPQSHLRGHDAW